MRSRDLSPDVQARLVKYEPPHHAHYAVVPAAPSRGNIQMGGRDTAQLVIEAERSLTQLSEKLKDTGSGFSLTRILERQEAVSTSIIEGTYSTLDALLELEEEGGGETETQEARGVSLALDYGLHQVKCRGMAAFNVDMICGLHKHLAGQISGFKGTPGDLRDVVVWIGGRGDLSTSTWNPPPPAYVSQCLEENVDYMRSEPENISQFNTIVRLAVAHAHFEAVHPFIDGNGRIGRLLIPLSLAARGLSPLYLSHWIEANKTDYYKALKDAQQRLDHSAMISVLARAIIGTHKEFDVTMAAIEAVEEEWSDLKLRKNSTAERTLKLLKSYPVLRARTLEQLLDVSFKAASDGLAKLAELGIITEKTGFSRNRIFICPAMLKIIMRPFGEDPGHL